MNKRHKKPLDKGIQLDWAEKSANENEQNEAHVHAIHALLVGDVLVAAKGEYLSVDVRVNDYHYDFID